MSITTLPTPPTRSDPINFNSRADAFLSALPTFATEANELQVDVNTKQVAAATSATNAATSAANALASENAAVAASNAPAWVSGTTYAIGNVRYSPITFLSYRRKTAGAGTTDPSADGTNWQLINALAPTVGQIRAWIRFNGTNGGFQNGANVTSVTRNSTGNYTINFTNALPASTYVVSFGAGTQTSDGTADSSMNIISQTTTSFQFQVIDGTANTLVDRLIVGVAFIC